MLALELRRAAAALALGAPTATIVDQLKSGLSQSQADTEAVVTYCNNLGVPLVPILEGISSKLQYSQELSHLVARGKTGAVITAAMLRWLPWLVLGASEWMGLHPLNFLLGSIAGKLLLGLALLLSVAATAVTVRIVRRAVAIPVDHASWYLALALASRYGARLDQAVDALPNLAEAHPARQSAVQILVDGGPIAESLTQQAKALRSAAIEAKEMELARLPFKLLLPLGSLLLPQFGILLVIPLLVNAAQQANLIST